MACALCLNERPLRNSHVIPELLYRSIYPVDGHRLKWIRSKGDEFDHEHAVLQKGLREHLLCDECERLLSKHETYVAEVLRSLPLSSLIPVRAHRQVRFCHKPNALVVENLDYSHFKLFELSLLWRSSVAKRIDYEQVRLGARHEQRIRTMLLSGDPGAPGEYGCGLFRLVDANQATADGLICSPYRMRSQGIWQYAFPIAGLLWLFNVSSHPAPPEWTGSFVSRDGVQVIWNLPFLKAVGPKLVGKKLG